MALDGFHPTLARWFAERLGAPTAAQVRGWERIRAGEHTLIAAPTGSGKTLAAFLIAIDALLSQGAELADECRVLYVSPLKALGNDIQKNLAGPLAQLRELDPALPEVRVAVRSGDTTQAERAAMIKRAPHVLVTTPETLYILLTSDGGRGILASVRTVIVDEIHALLGDKRGSHLALSLERLEALCGRPVHDPLQRIGLSATQKPLADVGRFLVGHGRACALVDEGHLRALDLAVEIPPSPLETVCSHETWGEVYERVAALIREHRTTLVFVGTRKMAERVSAQLARHFAAPAEGGEPGPAPHASINGGNGSPGPADGTDVIACHHSSLSKERRLDAEERLKAGRLRALVATASLELGIDVGDVDLVVQLGVTRSIATFLQRVGRAGHGVGRLPKGRLFPLTRDELVDAAALLRAVRAGRLDRTPQPTAPLDILAQQVVAACVPEDGSEDALYETLRRAWPYRALAREDFDAVLALHAKGRLALLHRDGVNARVRATKRARMTAIMSGGAIPDTAQYRVLLEPEQTFLGSIDEDFAVEATAGDVFQLGNASWSVLKVGAGVVHVADARGAPPSLPFWLGEAPARTRELADEVGAVREGAHDPAWTRAEAGFSPAAADELARYIEEGAAALGCVPTPTRLVLERFFDESGGMQLVLHAPLGGRINRALGLALRKRFCRRFGFELQAAANEDAIVLSLGPQHSFPLAEVFDYLHPASARELLEQAVLAAPVFTTRWRWNVTRALVLQRNRGGSRVPAPLLRMRADDLLAEAFPDVVACGETLAPGDVPIPRGHPLVRQTLDDCLHEALDVDGMLDVLEGLRDGRIERVAVDVAEPSPFARAILNAAPYAFLDDAPLEERRTQAVTRRRTLDARSADDVGALDPEAIARVRAEAWPEPADAEEVHEALLWMGYVTDDEAPGWSAWLTELAAGGRVVRDAGRWFAIEAPRDPKAVLRGRLEALGPVHMPLDDPLLLALEADGVVLRMRFDGAPGWCDRRLLARIQRHTLDRLRREIAPVSPADCLRFLGAWQHLLPFASQARRLEGPAGVATALRQLAGFEAPVATWEKKLLPLRVAGYRQEWLDELALRGELAWGRLWGSARSAPRSTPVCFLPRDELDAWLALSTAPAADELGWPARAVLEALRARGAMFTQDLVRAAQLLPSDAERGLEELVARGIATADSFASLRQLLRPVHRRRATGPAVGRWSLFRAPRVDADGAGAALGSDALATPDARAEFVARALLRRYGVVFRKLLERERQPLPWRDLARALRRLELRGDVRGGRFVSRFAGEQFALPEAVELLRRMRRDGGGPGAPGGELTVAAADPLNLRGILTPDERVPAGSRETVTVVGPPEPDDGPLSEHAAR